MPFECSVIVIPVCTQSRQAVFRQQFLAHLRLNWGPAPLPGSLWGTFLAHLGPGTYTRPPDVHAGGEWWLRGETVYVNGESALESVSFISSMVMWLFAMFCRFFPGLLAPCVSLSSWTWDAQKWDFRLLSFLICGVPTFKRDKRRLAAARKINRRRISERRLQKQKRNVCWINPLYLNSLMVPLFFFFVMALYISFKIKTDLLHDGCQTRFALFVFLGLSFWYRPLISCWCIARKIRNKLAHMITGNGAPSAKGAKGSGKSQGKSGEQQTIDPEIEFAKLMRSSMPEAARLRAQPCLVQDEWMQITKHWQHLDASGGIAICTKEAIPTVLSNIGFTANACGILIVQDPDSLHLVGYPRSKVKCTYDISVGGSERKHITVERFLVQLGFGDHVKMKKHGQELQVKTTVVKMIAKCSTLRGWPDGPAPAGVLSSFLSKVIPADAFSEIVPRNNGSFIFYCHEKFVNDTLRASGIDGIFTKEHGVEEKDKMELLWFDQSTPLIDALNFVKDDQTILGLAEKGKLGYLALRFRTKGDMVRYAKAHAYEQDLDLQRWKLSGLPATTGIEGVSTLLGSLGWKAEEIVYQDSDHVVFTSSQKGKDVPAHFSYEGQPRALKFKALNAAARTEAATAAQASRQMAFRPSTRAKEQQQFMARLNAAAPAEPSSPRLQQDKNKVRERTGETQAGQKARQT